MHTTSFLKYWYPQVLWVLLFFLLSIFLFLKDNAKKMFLEENHLLRGFLFGITGFFLHCLVDFDYADAAITTIIFTFAGLIESSGLSKKTRQIRLTKSIAGLIIIIIPFAAIIEFKTWHVGRIIESVKTGSIKENPIKALEKASAIFPEPEIFFMQGEIFRYIYNETRNIEFANMAINAYKKAIEINGLVPLYHKNACKKFSLKLVRDDEAEKHLLKMLEIYPNESNL